MDVKYTKDGKRIKLTKTEIRELEKPLGTLEALAECGDGHSRDAMQLIRGLAEKYAEPVLLKKEPDVQF